MPTLGPIWRCRDKPHFQPRYPNLRGTWVLCTPYHSGSMTQKAGTTAPTRCVGQLQETVTEQSGKIGERAERERDRSKYSSPLKIPVDAHNCHTLLGYQGSPSTWFYQANDRKFPSAKVQLSACEATAAHLKRPIKPRQAAHFRCYGGGTHQ